MLSSLHNLNFKPKRAGGCRSHDASTSPNQMSAAANLQRLPTCTSVRSPPCPRPFLPAPAPLSVTPEFSPTGHLCTLPNNCGMSLRVSSSLMETSTTSPSSDNRKGQSLGLTITSWCSEMTSAATRCGRPPPGLPGLVRGCGVDVTDRLGAGKQRGHVHFTVHHGL